MPLTFAHPLAAIPLRRLGLPLPALAIGAMIPDLVHFARLPVDYAFTHSVLGIVTVDLALAAVLLALWSLVLRAPLTDAAPAWVRERCPAPPPLTAPRARDLLAAAAALVLGAVTHIVWDAFTHPFGAVVVRVPALQAEVGPLPLYHWLQYGSSLLGVLGLALLAIIALGRSRPRPLPRRLGAPAVAVIAVPLALGALTAGLLIGVGWGSWEPETLAFMLATRTSSVAAVALVATAAAWWAALGIRSARTPEPPRGDQSTRSSRLQDPARGRS